MKQLRPIKYSRTNIPAHTSSHSPPIYKSSFFNTQHLRFQTAFTNMKEDQKIEAYPPWQEWTVTFDNGFKATESLLQIAFDQEMSTTGLRIAAGESLSWESRKLGKKALETTQQARVILRNFLENPTESKIHGVRIETIPQQMTGTPFIDYSTLRIEGSDLAFENSFMSLIVDPEGALLPTNPEDARTQVFIRLEEIDPKIKRRLLIQRESLDRETMIRELSQKLPPDKVSHIVSETRKFRRRYDDYWIRRMEATARNTYYHAEEDFLGNRGHPRYSEYTGIRVYEMLNGKVVIEATNRVLSGLDFAREIQLPDGTRFTGPLEKIELKGRTSTDTLEKLVVKLDKLAESYIRRGKKRSN